MKQSYLCLILLAAIPLACGPSAPPAVSPEAQETTATPAGGPVDGDWIVSRLPYEMATLNPLVSSHGALARSITRLVYEGLLKRDNVTWEMKPCLAESYEESGDHLAYTFRLRKGVTFSDGLPLTAEDVKFSFDIIMEDTSDTLPLRNYLQDVEACEVLDTHTVRFTCKEPYFKTLIALGEDLRILPKHIFGQGDFNKHPNNRQPIGTGPYVLETWDTNSQVILLRNDNYWGTKPHILKRLYRIVVDDNAAIQVLMRGELDIMGLTPDQWVNYSDKPDFEGRFKKLMYYTPRHGYIGWNMRRPCFSDKRVRQAMTMLLDREAILESILQGFGVVVTNSFFIDSAEYNKDIQAWPFDPKRAKELLDEAGWIDNNGNGVRDKDGVEFEFDFLVPSGSPETEAMITVLKEETDRAGIQLNIRLQEWATFIETTQKLDFDAMIMGWQLDPEQDPYQVWHSSQCEGGSNYPGLKNAEVDRIIETARQEFDPEKRKTLYHRMSEIIHDEQPYTFLYCTKARVAVDKRFRDVNIYALGLDAREWWVPGGMQKYK